MKNTSSENLTTYMLDDLFTIQSGTNIQASSKADASVVKTISIRDIDQGIIQGDSLATTSVDTPKKLERQTTRTGDVLLSTRGTVTKSAIVTTDVAGAIISSNLVILRAKKPSIIKPATLKAFFDSQPGQKALQSMVSGNAILHITTTRLKEMMIPVPGLQIQEELEHLLAHYQRYQQFTQLTAELSKKVTEQLLERVFVEGRMSA